MLIKSEDLFVFLHKAVQGQLGGYTDVILPTSNGNGKTCFTKLTPNATPILDSYRTVDPTKILFYLTRERMRPEEWPQKKRIILGVKACDLKALELMDRALINQDFVDPAYKHWRDTSTIITSDCGTAGGTCHCNLVGGQPFAESGFDLNLSRVNDDYLVTIGSDKGEALLDLMTLETTIETAPDRARQQVTESRKAVQQQLKDQNAPFERSNSFENLRSLEMAEWSSHSKTCIGCGACTHICPTCYCLILNDETDAQKFVKERTFDSCQLSGYARVAGGGTPRPEMPKRFRNRYLCKFDYMANEFDMLGCTGCGRCTDACAGEIDFRQVVHDTEEKLAAV